MVLSGIVGRDEKRRQLTWHGRKRMKIERGRAKGRVAGCPDLSRLSCQTFQSTRMDFLFFLYSSDPIPTHYVGMPSSSLVGSLQSVALRYTYVAVVVGSIVSCQYYNTTTAAAATATYVFLYLKVPIFNPGREREPRGCTSRGKQF